MATGLTQPDALNAGVARLSRYPGICGCQVFCFVPGLCVSLANDDTVIGLEKYSQLDYLYSRITYILVRVGNCGKPTAGAWPTGQGRTLKAGIYLLRNVLQSSLPNWALFLAPAIPILLGFRVFY